METRSSLPHLQDPATSLNREPHKSSPLPHSTPSGTLLLLTSRLRLVHNWKAVLEVITLH